MKSLPIAVFCLIAHTSILLSSDASYARDKSELQYLVAQGDAEAQYQLANHLATYESAAVAAHQSLLILR